MSLETPHSSEPSGATNQESRESVATKNVLLQESAAWVFESMPDAIALVDGQGLIATVNTRLEELFGYQREELVGKPVEKLMPERYRNGHVSHRLQYEAAPRTRAMGTGLELYGLRKDGREFPIEISLSPLVTDGGTVVLSTIRDVHDLKRVKDLQSSLEFETLMSRLSKTFINLPPEQIDGEINSGLKLVAEVLDLDRIMITLTDLDKGGRTFAHSWARPDIPAAPSGKTSEVFPWLASHISKGEICCWSALEDLPEEAVAERAHMESTGLKSWLTIPLVVGSELIGGMVATTFRRSRVWNPLLLARFQQAGDVFANALDRKHTAQVLRESQEQTELALDAANLGVWGWAIGGPKVWASNQTREWFGWAPDADLEYASSLETVHPDDRENVNRLIEQAIRDGVNYQAEFRIVRPDGALRWIKSLGRTYAGANGTPERFLGASLDITERKNEQEALSEQLAFERLLAELSGTFINIAPDQVDSQIVAAQKLICEALALDRSTLVMFSPELDEIVATHSWAAEGFRANPHMSFEEIPWIAQELLQGRTLIISGIDDLPQDAVKDRETFRRLGQKSNVTLPLSAGGKVIGALGFVSLQKRREWPKPLVERLGLVAVVFANALARKRADRELRTAYSEIERLKQRLEQENLYLREEIELKHPHNKVIGGSKAMRRVLKQADQVARTDSTVLLLGETGTGKEVVARVIHESSKRKDRPMVSVNCAALPATLIESELFGREKGAYTGALTREMGRFELANGSTLFLDEIGELPLELQAKLLRVLQEGEFERLGNPKTIHVDVRVIAATARNLRAAVKEGKFREDLFYRLHVFPITIPPLRERKEDIPALVWHFVKELGRRMGCSIESIHGPTMEGLKNYDWPGNVRELRNRIERLLITSTGAVLRADPTEDGAAGAQSQKLEDNERKHILQVLESTGWYIRGEAGAAAILGLKPTTLESRMRKLGITRPR